MPPANGIGVPTIGTRVQRQVSPATLAAMDIVVMSEACARTCVMHLHRGSILSTLARG
jgi:hypothetical protein